MRRILPLQMLGSPLLMCLALALAPIAGCERRTPEGKRKVVVLGFDGMDPQLCERLMDAGGLPNLARMRAAGGFRPLGTSIPPQSPVAWSNFITGCNPGVHGIFDFIHRDPSKQCQPYYAGASTVEGRGAWEVGDFRIPLTFWPFRHVPAHTELRRRGTPFWDFLDEVGVSVAKYDIPANYPPTPSTHGHACCLSGMGVPDLLGSYGTYQYFSEDTARPISEAGGMRKPLSFEGDRAVMVVVGPSNTYVPDGRPTELKLPVFRHPTDDAARIDLPDGPLLLAEGEWSGWRRLDFHLATPSFLPGVSVPGICRFYLKEIRPTFRLYVTPINIDPRDPGGQRISEPPGFVKEIAAELGPFYTAGFQEDHKALSNGVFTDEEFGAQAGYVLGERVDLLGYALDRFKDGLLFFYFSSTDLQAHMFWWDSERPHPTRTPDEARRCHGKIVELYEGMDAVVGTVVERVGADATVLVISDHGFCNFRRQFNLNTFLRENGYLAPADCGSLLNPSMGKLVDWSQSRAYGLGLNGLYVNLQGRERLGTVLPRDREALLSELTEKLLAVRDPADGQPVVARVYHADEVYDGPEAVNAPDLIVGYHRGYRASWATTLGDVEAEMVSDNPSAWSADHCIAAELVPGVVFANRPILHADPSLIDLAPTILSEFGVQPPAHLRGRSLFAASASGLAVVSPAKE